jgi:chorismate mutase-like protein
MANGLPLGDPAVTGEDLRSLRDRIDAIDEDIVRLLVQRAAVVQQVGHVKQQSGAPVFRPEREVSILERLCAANRAQGGGLPDASIAAIFIEIISGCRALEHVLKVAYLGPAGTYSEQAVRHLFGHRVEGLACASLDEALRMAEALLHYSPEPVVIERLLDSAALLGDQARLELHSRRYQAAYPQQHAQWLQRQQKAKEPAPAAAKPARRP